MLIQFTMGVSLLAHDIIILNVWMEKDVQDKLYLVPKSIEISPRYKQMQVKYPVGFYRNNELYMKSGIK